MKQGENPLNMSEGKPWIGFKEIFKIPQVLFSLFSSYFFMFLGYRPWRKSFKVKEFEGFTCWSELEQISDDGELNCFNFANMKVSSLFMLLIFLEGLLCLVILFSERLRTE